MSLYEEVQFRKQLSSILKRIAQKIEQDEEFARLIFSEIEPLFVKVKNERSKRTKQNESQHPSSIPDLFSIYLQQGTEGLRQCLENFEVQMLKEMILAHGLDPARKVRRWRVKERIINFIIEVITKQMSKGKAFLER
jgi:hypothetical protein